MKNSGNIEGMKEISKCLKFYVDFKNTIISSKNVYGFADKWVGTGCKNFCLLWREYMWSGVNVLKDGSNISDPTGRHDKQLTYFDINLNLCYKRCCEEWSSV